MMAEEMGLDIITARRAALMHDIGKVLWAETEAVGSHAVSGAAFAAAHGETPEIVHPIAAHHADEKPSTPLAPRRGSRRPEWCTTRRPSRNPGSLHTASRRYRSDLRRFSEQGIQRSYVIQGGREVRIEVDPRRVNDQAAARLSTDIARDIEETCVYPGQIKVTVLRETLANSYARS